MTVDERLSTQLSAYGQVLDDAIASSAPDGFETQPLPSSAPDGDPRSYRVLAWAAAAVVILAGAASLGRSAWQRASEDSTSIEAGQQSGDEEPSGTETEENENTGNTSSVDQEDRTDDMNAADQPIMTVTVDVFSGRPNPTFELTEIETSELRALVQGLSPSTDQATPVDGLGFRGFGVEPFATEAGTEILTVLPSSVERTANDDTTAGQLYSDKDGLVFDYIFKIVQQRSPEIAEIIE